MTWGGELVQNEPLRDLGKSVEGIDEFRWLSLKSSIQKIVDPTHEADVVFASGFENTKESGPFLLSKMSDLTFRLGENFSGTVERPLT